MRDFIQINGGQHAKRCHDDRHQDHHQHRPENSGPNAATGIGCTRAFAEELPNALTPDDDFLPPGHGVGRLKKRDARQRLGNGVPIGGGQLELCVRALAVGQCQGSSDKRPGGVILKMLTFALYGLQAANKVAPGGAL